MPRTTTRSRTALGVSALIALAACGGRSAEPCGRRADHSVVACFDGQPITATEVGEHLTLVGGDGGPRDHAALALDRALRVRTFAAEAKRRGLAGGDGGDARGRARLHQALIADEARRAGATPDAVALDDARALYAQRPGLFNKITGVWVRAIFSPDAASAEAARGEAAGLDEDGFAELARRISKDPSAAGGGDLGEAHADGIAPALRRAANDLRAAGELSGPVALEDGRVAILRASRVEMTVRPFADAERDVRNYLARQRETSALEALERQLRSRHRVERFDDALSRLAGPATEP